jgi:hypothetical protein
MLSPLAALRSVLPLLCLLTATLASAVTISPTNQTIKENTTLQFHASVASTWTTSCDYISSAGLFHANLYPGTCTVTAKAVSGGATASTKVYIVSPITMSPVAASTPQYKTQQFTASAPVHWTAKCGSISSTGLYTASGSVGQYCTIEGTAASGTAYHVYGYDHILSPTSSITISPTSAKLSENATQAFTSSASANWSATCGSISGSNTTSASYKAPLTAGSCTVKAAATSGGSVASAPVTVTSPITLTPASATTPLGGTQQFTASMAVTWSASCGSISSAGLFTASGTQGSTCSIHATATGSTPYTATASDTIAAPATFTVSPTTAKLSEGAAQQFTASSAATWSATCGSISTAGLYTAPLAPASCTITAKATSGSQTASASATITSPITITPASATTPTGGTQQFAASTAVVWSASCGSVSTAGVFTAPASPATCTLQATAASGTAYTATASDVVISAILNVTPTNPTLAEGAQQQFSAGISATWTASCGSISTAGLYTAPLAAGSCTVTATATNGSNQTANTIATITSPITITPASALLHGLGNQAFTASQAVTWSASCGSISTAGVFTAPAAAGTCAINATASSGTAYTASASATVDLVNQVRWRNSSGGTGLQSDELLLTPANVNSTTFGQSWAAAVDGGVWAEPLYMNALTVNGASHNVLFVATDNDSVYALDADTGAQLWKTSFLSTGVTAVAGTMIGDQYIPSIGVLGTPVIDPANGTLYVVAETAEQTATYFPHRLHALDITTGNEKFGGPVLISDPNLQPAHKLQRPGLVVANGTVYVAMGSLGDKLPYHGFVFSFDESTLAQTGVWNDTPTGSAGGIWMAGGAPTLDSSGNVYVLIGNGSFDGANNFGEAAVKLSPSLQVLDYFSPYNTASLTASDLDLGSASVPLMPDQNGQNPHELIFCGKPNVIYVLNRDSMGHFNSSTDNVVQEIQNQVGGTATSRDSGKSCFTSPSSWGQFVYFAANGEVLKQFTLNPSTGLLSTTPTYKGSFGYGWPGSQSVISSNGTASGVIWTFDNVGKTLRADNASNVSQSLYVSPAISTGYVKWTTPTVINGHVYVGGQGTVVAFTAR